MKSRFLLALFSLAAVFHSFNSRGADVAITVGSYFYSPSPVTINVGDTVTWTWTGSMQHTATAVDGSFDSGLLSPGATFQMTFDSPGNYPYYCQRHGAALHSGSLSVVAAVNSPPSVTITNPAPNTVYVTSPTNVVVQAQATDSDGTIANVEFFLDNVSIGKSFASPYGSSANNVASGVHSLKAVATDNSGATATNSISITVNAMPVASINFPTNNSVYQSATTVSITAAGSDPDGSITNVQLFINGLAAVSQDTSPISFSLTNATNGSYSLRVRATDNRGARTDSAIVNFFVTALQSVTPTFTNGQFSFSIHGLVPGKRHVIQGSTNLLDSSAWVSLKTNVASTSSTNFLDGPAPLPVYRFYRVIQLP